MSASSRANIYGNEKSSRREKWKRRSAARAHIHRWDLFSEKSRVRVVRDMMMLRCLLPRSAHGEKRRKVKGKLSLFFSYFLLFRHRLKRGLSERIFPIIFTICSSQCLSHFKTTWKACNSSSREWRVIKKKLLFELQFETREKIMKNTECPDLRVRDVTRSLVCYDSFFSPRREEELHAEIMRSRKIDWTMMIADGWWSTICTIIFPRLDSSLHLDSLAVRAIIPTRNRISSHLWKSSFNTNAIYAEHLLASSKAFGGLNSAIFSHSTKLNLQKRLPRAHTRCRWRQRGKVNTFLCFVHGVITSDAVEADIVAVLVSIT